MFAREVHPPDQRISLRRHLFGLAELDPTRLVNEAVIGRRILFQPHTRLFYLPHALKLVVKITVRPISPLAAPGSDLDHLLVLNKDEAVPAHMVIDQVYSQRVLSRQTVHVGDEQLLVALVEYTRREMLRVTSDPVREALRIVSDEVILVRRMSRQRGDLEGKGCTHPDSTGSALASHAAIHPGRGACRPAWTPSGPLLTAC
ncbi:hypothetical protein ACWCV9_14280 [Streptomyces sp. NPDC001606]